MSRPCRCCFIPRTIVILQWQIWFGVKIHEVVSVGLKLLFNFRNKTFSPCVPDFALEKLLMIYNYSLWTLSCCHLLIACDLLLAFSDLFHKFCTIMRHLRVFDLKWLISYGSRLFGKGVVTLTIQCVYIFLYLFMLQTAYPGNTTSQITPAQDIQVLINAVWLDSE